MNIKDKLVNDLIQDKAIELHTKLMETIDCDLLIYHEFRIGKRNIHEIGGISENDVNFLYGRLSGLRKLLNISLNDFLSLDIKATLDIIPNGYVSMKRQFETLLKTKI